MSMWRNIVIYFRDIDHEVIDNKILFKHGIRDCIADFDNNFTVFDLVSSCYDSHGYNIGYKELEPFVSPLESRYAIESRIWSQNYVHNFCKQLSFISNNVSGTSFKFNIL